MTDRSTIFDRLKEVALEDGKMTLEETQLISNVLRSATSFENALDRAKQDGVIDTQERAELDRLRTKIFEDAAELAEQDEEITADEAMILNKLMEVIMSLKELY